MKTKLIEIRDRGTRILVMAIMYVIEGMSIELRREHLNKLFGGTHGNT